MDQSAKVDAAIKLLNERGMWRSNAYPPIYRLFRKFGIHLKPPIFVPHKKMAFYLGVYFAIFWGGFMLIFVGPTALFVAPFTGAFFGLTMAGYYKWRRRKFDIPSWDDIKA